MTLIEKMNRTARSKGAVGKNAIVPKVVKEFANHADRILDYGSGKDLIHTRALREAGFRVDAFDIGANVTTEHIICPAYMYYDIVFASNVLNIQPDNVRLLNTIVDIMDALKPKGIFICNYPKTPRHFVDLTTEMLDSILRNRFNNTLQIKPGLWVCIK